MKDLEKYAQLCKEIKTVNAFEHGGKIFMGDPAKIIDQYLCVERNKSFHQWLIDDFKTYVSYAN